MDGVGFAIHLYSRWQLDWVTGGQYRHFVLLVRRLVRALRAGGVIIAVVLDGTPEDEKAATAKKRHLQRVERATAVAHTLRCARVNPYAYSPKFDCLRCGVDVPYSDDDIESRCGAAERASMAGTPPVAVHPMLLVEALVSALNQEGVPVFRAQGEADAEIASFCAAADCAGVLSNDSDFLIFPVPGLIPFETLHVSAGGVVSASLLSRDKLAAVLRMPTPQLATFACLAGNDVMNEAGWLHERIINAAKPSGRKKRGGSVSMAEVLHAAASVCRSTASGGDDALLTALFPIARQHKGGRSRRKGRRKATHTSVESAQDDSAVGAIACHASFDTRLGERLMSVLVPARGRYVVPPAPSFTEAAKRALCSEAAAAEGWMWSPRSTSSAGGAGGADGSSGSRGDGDASLLLALPPSIGPAFATALWPVDLAWLQCTQRLRWRCGIYAGVSDDATGDAVAYALPALQLIRARVAQSLCGGGEADEGAAISICEHVQLARRVRSIDVDVMEVERSAATDVQDLVASVSAATAELHRSPDSPAVLLGLALRLSCTTGGGAPSAGVRASLVAVGLAAAAHASCQCSVLAHSGGEFLPSGEKAKATDVLAIADAMSRMQVCLLHILWLECATLATEAAAAIADVDSTRAAAVARFADAAELLDGTLALRCLLALGEARQRPVVDIEADGRATGKSPAVDFARVVLTDSMVGDAPKLLDKAWQIAGQLDAKLADSSTCGSPP